MIIFLPTTFLFPSSCVQLSTSHQLLRAVEYIKSEFKDKRPTGALFLDIWKAFDRGAIKWNEISILVPMPLQVFKIPGLEGNWLDTNLQFFDTKSGIFREVTGISESGF
ncbi:hypothetical protein TNCV_4280161 [Trichonephila clavipes]|nr:hypothetical protein TNCV_4280161 [Trichonephila clavipes]